MKKDKIVRISNIEWDTDNEICMLPTTIDFPIDYNDNISNEDIERDMPDILSNEWGWGVISYEYEIIK
jgi:hypothetical protein